MQKIATIGLDLAKNVFQVHAATADGSTVFNRKLRRSEVLAFFAKVPSCLVGMEACSSAHYWARETRALGHDVRLMPPAYVKAFVKRGKTDAGDAEAISEAVTRKTMRFVSVKSAEQQAAAVLVKSRTLLVRQRTQAINALRSHLAEFGIIAGAGVTKVAELIAVVRDASEQRLPLVARKALQEIARQVESLAVQIKRLDRQIVVLSRQDADTRRLTTIPGVGAIIAASVKAFVPDPAGFRSGRHFAAWLGLTPRPHSSGGKERLGRISKMGNPLLRSLLVVGATSVLRVARNNPQASPWIAGLLARRPSRVATVALANKMARIIWALLVRGSVYRAPSIAQA